MTLRKIFLVALPLALAAVAAWMWVGKNGTHPASSAGPKTSAFDANPGKTSAGQAHDVASPSAQTPASPPADPARMTSSVTPGAPLVRTPSPPPRAVAGALASAADLPPPRPESQSEGRADLEGVRFMLRDFQTRMGENPVGSNAEIMRAVMGENSAGARLGPPAGQGLNADGELVDRWGTPYFFHQLSRKSMEIRSAGPDRRMWTADDLVTK